MKETKRKILYQQYAEKNIAEQEQKELSSKFGIAADKIVVKKESAGAQFLSTLSALGIGLLKVLAGVLVTGLISFALTVLFNAQLRTAVFEIMETW